MTAGELITWLGRIHPNVQIHHADLNFPGSLQPLEESDLSFHPVWDKPTTAPYVLISSPAQTHIE